MIQHIVLFEWNEDLSAERIATATDALRTLSGIETASAFAAGDSFGGLAKGYDFAVVLRLPDRKALKEYWPHPLHEKVLAVVQPVCANVLVVDFEI